MTENQQEIFAAIAFYALCAGVCAVLSVVLPLMVIGAVAGSIACYVLAYGGQRGWGEK